MNSILDRIRKTMDKLVEESKGEYLASFYGLPTDTNPKNNEVLKKWNYFIFRRKSSARSDKGSPIQTKYLIHIIHEDFIPEGYVDKVINSLESKDDNGTKLKLCSDDITYEYIKKGNSDIIIEVATIVVTHPERRS